MSWSLTLSWYHHHHRWDKNKKEIIFWYKTHKRKDHPSIFISHSQIHETLYFYFLLTSFWAIWYKSMQVVQNQFQGIKCTLNKKCEAKRMCVGKFGSNLPLAKSNLYKEPLILCNVMFIRIKVYSFFHPPSSTKHLKWCSYLDYGIIPKLYNVKMMTSTFNISFKFGWGSKFSLPDRLCTSMRWKLSVY